MPPMQKSKLLAFAKKTASPPPAATALAKKRAAVAPPPAPHAAGGASHGAAPGGDDQQVELFEMVEDAAQAAEAGQDTELEDVIAGYTSHGAQDVPAWAEDPQKWAEAAQAVGLGGAGEDMYDEPFVVTAYLYRMMQGPVAGLELPAAPGEAPPADADMGKPGAAAKAMHAKLAPAAGKPPAHAAPAGKPPLPAGKAPVAPPAKPAPHPAAAKPPGHAPLPGGKPPTIGGKPPAPLGGKGPPGVAGAKPGMPPAKVPPKPMAPHAAPGAAPPPGDGGDELKQLIDEAAQQAATSPDPAVMQKLQAEPPQEGIPPIWAVDQEKWTQAESAVKPHWTEYPDPFAVVAHVYLNLGGQLQ